MSVTDTTIPPTAAPPADPVRAALGDPVTRDNLVRIARSRYPGNSTLIDDVVQEACERALTKRSGYDPSQGSVFAWLTGFLRNIYREQVRKDRRLPLRPDLDLAEVVPDRPGPDDMLTDRRRVYEECVSLLSPGEQEVLHLAHTLGLRGDEIAARLGITKPATRKRVSRAMGSLTRIVKQRVGEGQS